MHMQNVFFTSCIAIIYIVCYRKLPTSLLIIPHLICKIIEHNTKKKINFKTDLSFWDILHHQLKFKYSNSKIVFLIKYLS